MKKQRIMSIICTLCLTLSITVLDIRGIAGVSLPITHAEEREQKKSTILILGDDISANENTPDEKMGYYDYVAECTESALTNLAVPGFKTTDLISLLNDSSKGDIIKSSDIICISIGINDLLEPTRDYFNSFCEEGETAMQLLQRLAADHQAEKFIAGLTGVLRDPRNQAVDNYPVIAEKLRALNPNARIIMQTIYNPYEMPQRFFNSQSEYDDYVLFSKYLNGNLSGLNKAMSKLDNIYIADVYTAFAGAGWIFSKTLESDVYYPTAIGNTMIAALVLDQIGQPIRTSNQMTQVLEKTNRSDLECISFENLKHIQPYVDTQVIDTIMSTATMASSVTTSSTTLSTKSGITSSILNSESKSYVSEPSFSDYRNGHHFVIGNICGQPGETVSVPIYIFGDPGTAGVQIYIDLDSKLTMVSFETPKENRAYRSNPQTKTESRPATYTFAITRNYKAKDGSILTLLNVIIPSSAVDGDVYEIKFHNDEKAPIKVIDYNGEVLPVSFHNGSISVGDVAITNSSSALTITRTPTTTITKPTTTTTTSTTTTTTTTSSTTTTSTTTTTTTTSYTTRFTSSYLSSTATTFSTTYRPPIQTTSPWGYSKNKRYTTDGDLWYDFGTVITYCDAEQEIINIPSYYNRFNITDIGANAFSGHIKMKEISFTARINTIGVKAFADCKNLEKVSLSENLTKIGDYAFLNCSKLSSITIPKSVTEIGSNAFQGCNNLTIHGYSNSFIEEYAKNNNLKFEPLIESTTAATNAGIVSTNQTTQTTAKGTPIVTTTGRGATPPTFADGYYWYYKNEDNQSVTISEYNGLSGKVSIPEKLGGLPVTKIGKNAFSGYTYQSPIDVIVPSSVKQIGDYAFAKCSGLRSISIPTSVTEIGMYAFSECSNLQNIQLPNSITKIGKYAFSDCISLTSFVMPPRTTTLQEGVLSGCRALTSVALQAGVSGIDHNAFNNCRSLSVVTCPDSIKILSGDIFNGCSTNLVIKGYSGSIVESYAATNQITFSAIGQSTMTTTAATTTTTNTTTSSTTTTTTTNTTTFSTTSTSLSTFITTTTISTTTTLPTYYYDKCLGYIRNPDSQSLCVSEYRGEFEDVIVPAIFNGLPVTDIGRLKDAGNGIPISFRIPDSVVNIDLSGYKDTIIKATEGSYAEKYAKENGFQFELVDVVSGDIDHNNLISVEDAQYALNAYVSSMAGLESGLTKDQTKAADINGDDIVAVEDAQTILLYYVRNTLSGETVTWDELIAKAPQSSPRPQRLLTWRIKIGLT